MELSHIIYAAIAFSVIHFWWKTMQARERAQKYAVSACIKDNVQLLDGTVAFKKVALEKSSRGRRYFLRYFNFEFSTNGQDRRKGYVAMYGTKLYYSYLDLPESPTIEVEASESSSQPSHTGI